MARTYPVKIKKKIQEAAGSVSLVLDVPLEYKKDFIYSPAQFLTFLFYIKGKKYLRSYSLSSCPLLNEPLKTTVKRVHDGLVSNYIIDHLKEGDEIVSRRPAGRFFKPPGDLKPKQYYLFAAGSGITPIFSIIKTVLSADSGNQVRLFYANRSENSIIYKKELADWENKKKLFNIVHLLSQPKASNNTVFSGRLNKEFLQKYVKLRKNNHELFYLCGPEGFMQTAENFLAEQGVSKTYIHKESFVSKLKESDQHTPKEQENKLKPTESATCSNESLSMESITVCAGNDIDSYPPSVITALINSEKIKITAQPGIPILEQLLAAGYSPPFSCLSGNCMSCLAVLKKGRITQDEQGILEEDNLANKEILTCQAKPESSDVEVDYDNI